MSIAVVLFLSALLVASSVALSRVSDLLALVVLLGVFSGLITLVFALLLALDVAFTEAVVGTGISAVFYMALVRHFEPGRLTRGTRTQRAAAGAVALSFAALMVYAILALPPFGDPNAPASTYLSPTYGERALPDLETPNVVTAVLADYRSFDTLVETTVIVTAAIACGLILRRKRR